MMDLLGLDPLHFGDPFLLKIGNPNFSLVGHMEIPNKLLHSAPAGVEEVHEQEDMK